MPDQNATPAWLVEPSGPLRGEVRVAGSKNAVTKHMVAAVMGTGPSVIENIPDVGDVRITTEILQSLGVGVDHADDRVTIHPADDIGSDVGIKYTGLNRIPILLLGPLLHLRHEVFVPLPGGDRIGRRPVDFHVDALRAMGADVEETDAGIRASASRLQGAQIELPYPSVMATETVLLAAAMAEGRTVLSNAATEPEIVELALFLQRMGARLEQRPGRQFVIEGVESLRGASTRLQGDRLEAFSYLVAGLITGGNVRVAGCTQDRLVTAITTLSRMGAEFEVNDDWITASADGLQPVALHTDTHPGFMTDWQSPLLVLMTQADGMSVLHETVFEDRVRYPASVVRARPSSSSTPASVVPPAASTIPTPCTRPWCAGSRSSAGRTWRSPTSAPASPASSPPQSPRDRHASAASTTSNGATTSHSRPSSHSVSAWSGWRAEPPRPVRSPADRDASRPPGQHHPIRSGRPVVLRLDGDEEHRVVGRVHARPEGDETVPAPHVEGPDADAAAL